MRRMLTARNAGFHQRTWKYPSIPCRTFRCHYRNVCFGTTGYDNMSSKTPGQDVLHRLTSQDAFVFAPATYFVQPCKPPRSAMSLAESNPSCQLRHQRGESWGTLQDRDVRFACSSLGWHFREWDAALCIPPPCGDMLGRSGRHINTPLTSPGLLSSFLPVCSFHVKGTNHDHVLQLRSYITHYT